MGDVYVCVCVCMCVWLIQQISSEVKVVCGVASMKKTQYSQSKTYNSNFYERSPNNIIYSICCVGTRDPMPHKMRTGEGKFISFTEKKLYINIYMVLSWYTLSIANSLFYYLK